MGYLESITEGLNESQLKAATSIDRNSIVLSCPGSGKTKTVESKVCLILAKHPEAKVCCTTFSREAAKEMRERIESKLPPSMSESERKARLRVGTFHSICKEVVERHTGKKSDIISEGERKYHIEKAMVDLKMGSDPELFDEIKPLLDSFPTMQDDQKSMVSRDVQLLYAETKKRIHALGKVTFDDLLIKALNLFESGEIPLLDFTHIICDEGQDSDILMYRFLKIHADGGKKITLMLDDDQTLYSFRNSLGVNICRWLEEQCNAVLIENATNYRSREEVLVPARRLINTNTDRIKKSIISHRGEGGSFNTHITTNQYVTANLIESLVTENPGEWFILCRTNEDVRQICELLIEKEIPFHSTQTNDLRDRKEVQAYIELLTSLASNAGMGVEIAFKLCIGTQKDLDSLLTENGEQSLIKLLKKEAKIPSTFDESQKEKCSSFIDRCVAWQLAIRDGREPFVLRLVADWLANNSPKYKGFALETAMSIMLKSHAKRIPAKINDLNKFLDEQEKKKTGDGVVMVMTAHASKGLQRKSVIVWSLREESFPAAYRSGFVTQEQHIEEERRILYVAMTRAEDNLHLVFQEEKQNIGNPTYYHPSRFLRDMDINCY